MRAKLLASIVLVEDTERRQCSSKGCTRTASFPRQGAIVTLTWRNGAGDQPKCPDHLSDDCRRGLEALPWFEWD